MQIVTSYTPERISEARQAIFGLARFPKSRKDLRIRSDLKTTIVAQGVIKKTVALLTCDLCFSRKRYENNTSLELAHAAFKENIRILYQTGHLTKELPLQEACEAAQEVFNASVVRCSKYRKKELGLEIDYQQWIQEFSRQSQIPQSPMRPPFPRKANKTIDYVALLRTT